jgi:hypothetical protein
MDLKDFIGQVLADIVHSVIDAQLSLGENGKYINPQLSTHQGPLEKQGNLVSIQGQPVQTVEFDVAATAAKANSTKGGIGVVAAAIVLGSQGQSSAESSSVSRIKFSVPVTLPYGDKMPSRGPV